MSDDEKRARIHAEMEARKRIVLILRNSWTEEGVVLWFGRRHPGLDGQTPNAVLAEGDLQRVIDLAEAGRSQGST